LTQPHKHPVQRAITPFPQGACEAESRFLIWSVRSENATGSGSPPAVSHQPQVLQEHNHAPSSPCASTSGPTHRRKRGRPRTHPIKATIIGPKRPVGRPRKQPSLLDKQDSGVKRPAGRPRKQPATGQVILKLVNQKLVCPIPPPSLIQIIQQFTESSG